MADKRYIDADKLTFSRVRIIHSDGTIGGWHAVVMSSVIKDAPAADVVEVRHGEWKQATEPCGWHDVDCVVCSACGESWVLDEDFDFDVVKDFWNYCPTCGAKMDATDNNVGDK